MKAKFARAGSFGAALVAALSGASAFAAIGDFNGDGIGDLAIGVPHEDLQVGNSNRADAGIVTVIYGTANNGLRAQQAGIPTSQEFSEDSTGVADASAPNDQFGAAVAAGDFDDDGIDDLVVLVPGDNGGHGAIHVFRGATTSGLSGNGEQFITASQIDDFNNLALFLGGSALDAVGNNGHLAVGDFNGDGVDDLAIEAREASGNFGQFESKIVVLPGRAGSGLTTSSQLFAFTNTSVDNPDGAGILGACATLAAADFNGDGRADLAVGLPFSDLNSTLSLDVGRVGILLGGTNGLTIAGFQTLTPGGASTPGEHFGMALATGDFDGDGVADLAVGSPNRSSGALANAGGAKIFSHADQLTADLVATVPLAGDLFGAALAAADLNDDGRADLAVGLPGHRRGTSVRAGRVIVFLPAITGFPGQIRSFDAPSPFANNRFGSALNAGNVGRSNIADLIVGAPGRNVQTSFSVPCNNPPINLCLRIVDNPDAGLLRAFYGSATGPATTGTSTFHQDAAAIPDTVEASDQFGGTL